MSKELKESLERVLDGIGNDDDLIKLKTAFMAGDIKIASGERAVITRDNNKSLIITGDNNDVVNLNIDKLEKLQVIIPESKLINNSSNIFAIPYSILAHFLDHYVQGINISKNDKQAEALLRKRARQALNISIICSDKVLLPAVSYVQSQMTQSILNEYKVAIQAGLIELLGDGITWGDFCEMRLRDYNSNSPEYNIYKKISRSFVLSSAFSPVEGSITDFIESTWLQRWNKKQDTFKIFYARDRLHLQEGFEEKVFNAAYNRKEDAFISRNVAKQIFSYIDDLEEILLTDDICAIFFDYFLQKPKTVFLSQIPGFKYGEPRNNLKKIEFHKLVRLLAERSKVSVSEILNVDWEEGLLKFGETGKYCIQDLLKNVGKNNEITDTSI
jgi:hypothetical protein